MACSTDFTVCTLSFPTSELGAISILIVFVKCISLRICISSHKKIQIKLNNPRLILSLKKKSNSLILYVIGASILVLVTVYKVQEYFISIILLQINLKLSKTCTCLFLKH